MRVRWFELSKLHTRHFHVLVGVLRLPDRRPRDVGPLPLPVAPHSSAAVGLYLRLRPVAVAITDRPTEDRDLGHVLEMRPDRRTAESLRGLGLHWNGLSHVIHQLNIL